MTESIRYLCENAPLPVSVLPNAGLPSIVDGKMHYDETPETFTAQVIHFAGDFGVNVVGGCCGTTPAHLKLVVEAMQRITPKARNAALVPAASSIYFQQPYIQDASFLIVGERVNASGSKKMRDLLNAEDWDGLVSLAKDQEREGAHVLDVNVDFVGRDGEADMHELASRLVTNIKLPLMFDSTEWQKMEAGLQHAGGKSILNSTNYEDGVPRFTKVIDLAKRYGASVVIGTIDEEGMARTAEGKFKIAKRAYNKPPENWTCRRRTSSLTLWPFPSPQELKKIAATRSKRSREFAGSNKNSRGVSLFSVSPTFRSDSIPPRVWY